MSHCPRCNAEYIEGITECPDCGILLVAGPPMPEVGIYAANMVALRTVSDPSEAEVIQATLAEAGIPSSVRRHGPITGELGRVTDGITEDYAIVSVPQDRLAEAEELLDAIEEGAFEWPAGMEPDEGESG
jgi:hypothetical protein